MLRYMFWLITTTLWIIALADAIRGGGTLGRKLVSVALIIAFPVIGPLLYLFALRDWAHARG
ncbi:MAG: PLDc N-terminal domain-containing protein [Chloracidobacterium sp.]|uniref:PLDc N-terminal domain-containing protein n=1 Tax=Chloracidobacterium validum TaxID=2821543 RepID=A0ABX8B7W8_9BACT|nr:PLDc N-terminal domain-containing protein [Chloracidobacterium validum]QUW02779.1 PLDc N-terminal domain-containing protein [Chloracidobacterium validum]